MAEMAKTPRFTKEEIIRIVKEQNIRFVRLQFTDIFGQCKNVAITESQLEKALANKCMFDGSSIEGFVRIEESDMYLYPDLDSFMIYPWKQEHGKVARLICDVHKTDGAPFEGATPEAFCAASWQKPLKWALPLTWVRSANSSCSRLTTRGIPRPPLSTTEAILSWALWTGGRRPEGYLPDSGGYGL